MLTLTNTSVELESWWHPVARSVDLGEHPVRVELLGQAWALARLDGTACAFADRCPHRGVRLSTATPCVTAAGAALRCAYHGWAFAGDGRCVEIPGVHDAEVRRSSATTAAAVTEAHGLVWIAPRRPHADPLSFPEALDPAFTVQHLAVRHMPVPAAQLVENNLDWTHVPFVHVGTFGPDTVLPTPGTVVVHRDGWRISVEFEMALVGGRWHGHPAHHVATVGAPFSSHLRVELPDGAVNTYFQTIQPVGERSSIVYQSIAANDVDAQSAAADAEFNQRILDEDLAVLSMIDDTTYPVGGDTWAHVPADRPSGAFRRMLRDVLLAG